MKAFPSAPALVAALLLAGCASSDWAKTESVPGGKLYVPKLYAPLLPGSIYPDRKTPVPAKGRPAIVLVCPEKGDCREDAILAQAAQRGLVVLAGKDPRRGMDLLRTRPEADAERIGWLLVAPTGEFLRRWSEGRPPGKAVAILAPTRAADAATAPPPPPASPLPSSPSKKIFFAALQGAEPLEAHDGAILKLYSPNPKGLLPREALRDAVEWLASELGAGAAPLS